MVVDLNLATGGPEIADQCESWGTVYLQAVVLRLRHPGPEKLEDDVTQTPQVRKNVHVVTLAGEAIEDGAGPEGEALRKREKEGEETRGGGERKQAPGSAQMNRRKQSRHIGCYRKTMRGGILYRGLSSRVDQ